MHHVNDPRDSPSNFQFCTFVSTMAKFILKEPSSKDKTLIYLVYYFDGRRFKYSTGQQIDPKDWNKERQRPRRDYHGYKELYSMLERLSNAVEDIHRKILNDEEIPTVGLLRREMDLFTNRAGKGRETLVQFIERFIAECGKKDTSLTIFKTVLKHLKEYSGSKNFEDINAQWLAHYTNYLEGKDFSANYIGKNISTLKQFLNEAVEQKITRSTDYKSSRYIRPSEDVSSIYLTTEELVKMYGTKLTPGKERVRDLFLVGAFTALRFSDIRRLADEHISGGFIRIRHIKTGETVVIPLHWIVKEIYEKYDNGFPEVISNQKMNKALKLIGRRCGIKNVVVKSRTKGGVSTSEAFEKWKLISTHTARRSAATNMYLAGIPAISIMKITGHKTESSFMKYIRISQEENAMLMQEHKFFHKPETV